MWTGTDRSVTGIISGLNADGSVRFNYPEPGFFVNEDATYKAASDGSTQDIYEKYIMTKSYNLVKLGIAIV